MSRSSSPAAATGVLAPTDADVGVAMHQLIARLYPICRSITGDGVRKTLGMLREDLANDGVALTVHEVPTATQVFDWTVPSEWNIRDAYIKNSRGERVIDFARSNLHLVGYSRPVRATMTLDELKGHLHSDPDHPDWIPYRTSYYDEAWGFCLSQRQLDSLPEDEYEVCVDSSLTHGYLTYGEVVLSGEIDEEVLISCHVCHPSLCNDNLSGVAIAAFLARALQRRPRRHTYRLLFVPGLIGPLTWLARNPSTWPRVKHGLVLACAGDAGQSTYKKTRDGSADIDRAVEYVLKQSGQPYEIIDFSPWGYDERQYGSPGINLAVGCLMRTPHGRFPEYHTSADNLELVRPEALADTLRKCLTVADVLDGNRRYINQSPYGEPQLGRRGLYSAIGGDPQRRDYQLALLWVLNLSDGRHTLLDIAQRAQLDFPTIRRAADALEAVDLLREASPQSSATSAAAPLR